MSLLTRHFLNAIVERFLSFRDRAQIKYTETSGTSKVERTFSALSMARMADTARRNVALAVSTTINQDQHESRMIIMGGAGAARTFTLPAATGSGSIYTFVVGAVNTSNYLIKTAAGTDTFDGSIINGDSDTAGACRMWSPAATDDTITLNGTTTGGSSIGDWVEVQDIATNQWAVTGVTTGTGTVATPFSDTVA
jgi:hypothetical protein